MKKVKEVNHKDVVRRAEISRRLKCAIALVCQDFINQAFKFDNGELDAYTYLEADGVLVVRFGWAVHSEDKERIFNIAKNDFKMLMYQTDETEFKAVPNLANRLERFTLD